MIQITKPIKIPKKLTTDGLTETNRLINLFDNDSDYQTGLKKFEFKSSIYGHATVKNALRKSQHNKCCFCERKTEIGDVEHFRGKGGYQQTTTDKIIYPGYFWLAYTWDNLFFSCEKCNRSFKRNLFPLVDNTKRATAQKRDINEEEPLLIDPSKENPEDFIEFIGTNPKAINGNQKGQETINRIGLGRPFLDEEKLELYKAIKTIFHLSENPSIPQIKRSELKDLVKEYALQEKAYSSMIKCAIRDKFRF